MYYYISKDIEFIDKYTTEQVLLTPPSLSPLPPHPSTSHVITVCPKYYLAPPPLPSLFIIFHIIS